MVKLDDIELKVVHKILEDGYIASKDVRVMLNSNSRVILTKHNFPNIRHLLYAYMTAFRHGMYRGGMSWVCVIGTNDEAELRRLIKNN